jgi:hypothetical protein
LTGAKWDAKSIPRLTLQSNGVLKLKPGDTYFRIGRHKYRPGKLNGPDWNRTKWLHLLSSGRIATGRDFNSEGQRPAADKEPERACSQFILAVVKQLRVIRHADQSQVASEIYLHPDQSNLKRTNHPESPNGDIAVAPEYFWEKREALHVEVAYGATTPTRD